MQFSVESGEFVQVLHVFGSHWVVGSQLLAVRRVRKTGLTLCTASHPRLLKR